MRRRCPFRLPFQTNNLRPPGSRAWRSDPRPLNQLLSAPDGVSALTVGIASARPFAVIWPPFSFIRT